MSCATLSQGLVGLNVAMASLPEGFCPTSMQDLANAIAARLVVTPNTSSSSFAIGAVPPTSNVGPWFKDCEEWFKYDDATATYVPLTKQGFDNMQYFAASGTFTVPDFISKIKITAFGGGGGGQTGDSGAGGGGAFGVAIRTVIPGQAIAIVVGSGGAAGSPGASGGATTILGMSAAGGGGGTGLTTPGIGGAATGFDFGFNGQTGGGNPGGANGHGQMGGDAGGWGGKGGGVGNTGAGTSSGTAPGGGGSSGSSFGTSGGAGANGGCLIEW